jgi:hypothetical protein
MMCPSLKIGGPILTQAQGVKYLFEIGDRFLNVGIVESNCLIPMTIKTYQSITYLINLLPLILSSNRDW